MMGIQLDEKTLYLTLGGILNFVKHFKVNAVIDHSGSWIVTLENEYGRVGNAEATEMGKLHCVTDEIVLYFLTSPVPST